MSISQFFLGGLSSLLASLVFLFIVLIVFKPKIFISPHICKGKLNVNDPIDYYFIKIINISLFSAYDVKLELLQIDKYTSENTHMNTRNTALTLVVDHISHIPSYRPSWLRKNAPYAIRIRTVDELEPILTDDYKSVMIKVSLKHALTGLVKVKKKEYTDISQLKVGRFKYGLTFGILN